MASGGLAEKLLAAVRRIETYEAGRGLEGLKREHDGYERYKDRKPGRPAHRRGTLTRQAAGSRSRARSSRASPTAAPRRWWSRPSASARRGPAGSRTKTRPCCRGKARVPDAARVAPTAEQAARRRDAAPAALGRGAAHADERGKGSARPRAGRLRRGCGSREAEERQRGRKRTERRKERDHEERERKEREAAARRKAEEEARHRVEEEGRPSRKGRRSGEETRTVKRPAQTARGRRSRASRRSSRSKRDAQGAAKAPRRPAPRPTPRSAAAS